MIELQVRRAPARLTLVLNQDAYIEAMRACGITTDTQAAEVFGVDRSFVSRFRGGSLRGGNHLIAGMVHALEPNPSAWTVLPTLFSITPEEHAA